jgi:hypothetical protein
MRFRRKDVLTYATPEPPNAYGALARALARFNGRSTIEEWRARCDASLAASRARRKR